MVKFLQYFNLLFRQVPSTLCGSFSETFERLLEGNPGYGSKATFPKFFMEFKIIEINVIYPWMSGSVEIMLSKCKLIFMSKISFDEMWNGICFIKGIVLVLMILLALESDIIPIIFYPSMSWFYNHWFNMLPSQNWPILTKCFMP